MKKALGLFLMALTGFVLTGFASGGYDLLSHGEANVIFMMMWLLMVYLIMKSVKKLQDDAFLSVIAVFLIMITMMSWAYFLSCDYLVFRTKQTIKMKYGDELVLRGEDFYNGNTYAVYYRASEPEYFFHAHTSLFSLEPFDNGYKRSVAASMLDDEIELLIQDVIPGEFKMSSECMSIRFYEELTITDVHSMIDNTSYFQMYCVLDNSLIEQKDEIIENVTEIIAPLFKNAEATIFFAFVSDVQSSERYSVEYRNTEDTLVRLEKSNH